MAVDIGTGTGQIASVIASEFKKVYGFDTSAKMLESATKADNVEYAVGNAEELPTLQDNSVDLVTVGQAAHWFNHAAWFKEMYRILKPNGTLSFWSYVRAPQEPGFSVMYGEVSPRIKSHNNIQSCYCCCCCD